MLNVTGLDAAIRFNSRVAHNPKFQKMMEQIVSDSVSLIRRYCPVDTGNLMESIRYEKVNKYEFRIIIDVPYATYMEYGTKYFPAKGSGTPENPLLRTSTSGKECYFPFIRPAIWEMSKLFPQYIDKIFVDLRRSGTL